MKRIIVFLGLLCFFTGWSRAQAPLVLESLINAYGTPTTVSISTLTWTKVPTSQTSGRTGVILDEPATNTANMAGHLGNCTSSAIATTIRPIELIKGNAYSFINIREDVCLWLLSLHTSAESIHYQEIKQ